MFKLNSAPFYPQQKNMREEYVQHLIGEMVPMAELNIYII